jgi:serine protease Do
MDDQDATASGGTNVEVDRFVSVVVDDTLLPAVANSSMSNGSNVETSRWVRGIFVGALVGALVASVVSVTLVKLLDSGSAAILDVHSVVKQIDPAVVRISIGANGSLGVDAGTGFFIDTNGSIVTNAHVVEGADLITAETSDGRIFVAELLGADPTRDLAVLKIEVDGPTVAARLGSSAGVQVGDPVLVIGNALGLAGGPSVTTGIVSAIDRAVPTASARPTNILQTDAAINPGNSGGPLVNASGEVIGISTAIAGNAEGIGFAIEIDHARPVIDLLVQGVVPTRPLLGVGVADASGMDESRRAELGVTAQTGAVVVDVTIGKGAESAGLQVGDVITAFGSTPIENSSELVAIVRGSRIGASVTVVFSRGDVTMDAVVELGELLGAGG